MASSLHLCCGIGGRVSAVNVIRRNEKNRVHGNSFHGRRKNVCLGLQESKEPITAASALLGKTDPGSKMQLSSLMAAVSDDLQGLNDKFPAIQEGRSPNWPFEEKFSLSTKTSSILEAKTKWTDLDLDIHRWIRSSQVVQWYPGHIAKAERELKQQLKLMDVVVEVRDARIPMATSHPEMDSWIGERKKILVLNREDMISTADKNAWAAYFSRQGITVIFANGRLGMGTMKLARMAKSLADNVNAKRRAKGLLPRAVRAGVVGYPNVGKSSLINRLLKRKVCATAPRPGVTRELKWIRIGKDLDLLDSPGILPLRFNDQAAATKLAICDDIGERSYAVAGVATILIEMLKQIPTAADKLRPSTAGASVLYERYKIDADGCSGEIFLKALGHRLFNGDVNQAAFRILQDFRKGKFGWIALERPKFSSRFIEDLCGYCKLFSTCLSSLMGIVGLHSSV